MTLGGERLEGRLPGRQGPLVVALLACNRARPVAREELIGALWPGRPPADPEEALSAVLSKVRHVLGKDVLQGRRELTLVLPDDAEVDLEQAVAAVERAQAAAASSDWTGAWEAGTAAAQVTGRGFLVGLDAPWVEDRRREIDELRLRALEVVARAGVALGGARIAGAEHAARELTRAAPRREAGHRYLMEALAARGEAAEALAAYEALRVVLRDELGTAPGREARALHERLLAGEPEPGAQRVPLPALLARERGELIGRTTELDTLRAAWADACDSQRRLVLVAGGPGIGKTRLVGELAREAHARGTVLYAGCLHDALVAYQPFVEALRHYARNASLGTGSSELARLIPELGDPGARDDEPADPETRRYLLFEAVSTALTSDGTPLLLVIDDLHWADRSTLQLLRHIVRAQHEAPLLILGTYRELEVIPEHPLFELLADLRRDGLYERVSLEGLDRGGVGALMEAQAGTTAPTALVKTVHATTEGNPFFVEEVVRHLIETGRWTARVAPDDVGVPEGVKEVLGHRLRRLSPTCRDQLSHAAVLGREFSFDRLTAMTGDDEDTVIGALEEALGARLVEEQKSVYSFTHALVRETLYGALSTPRRQRMHARAAGVIERSGDPDVDALALHYRRAGDAVDSSKAIEYSLRAGDRARQLFAWDEAAAHLDGALGLMERADADPAQRAALLVELADLCAVTGALARQIGYLQRALELYTALGDEERSARVHSSLGMAYCLIDPNHVDHLDVERAGRHFAAARAVLDRGPPRRALGHLETAVATSMVYGMQIPEGIESAARAMEIGERFGDEALWVDAAEAFGWLKLAAGDLAAGFDVLRRAFEVADRAQRPFPASMALTVLGQYTWALADPDGAQPVFERMLTLPYAGTNAHSQMIKDSIGRCHILRGEREPARRLLPDARPAWPTHALAPLVDLWEGTWDRVEALAAGMLKTSRQTGSPWDEFAAHHLAARVSVLRGEPELAIEPLERARRMAHAGGAAYYELWVLPDLARACAHTDRLDQARVHIDRCRELAGNGEDWRGRAGTVAVAEAVVLSCEGRTDEADACFASALETLRTFRLVPTEADALHEWGAALARAGDRPGADEKRAAATALYAAHGAGAAWLKRS